MHQVKGGLAENVLNPVHTRIRHMCLSKSFRLLFMTVSFCCGIKNNSMLEINFGVWSPTEPAG